MDERTASQRVIDDVNRTLALFVEPKPRLREERGLLHDFNGVKIGRLQCADEGSLYNGKYTVSKTYELLDLDLDIPRTRAYFERVRSLWLAQGFAVTDEEMPNEANENGGTIGVRKPDGFGMRISSNTEFITLISSSPCVWPKGHPE